ncbi:MAG: VWA domain-containing protein [Syntrophales bacterium]|nr:VWA domain-containing protein [Syntrophales bacterium]
MNAQKDSQEGAKVQLQSDNKEQGNSSKETSLPTYSLTETLREKDFKDIQPSEFAEFDELFKSLRIKEKKGRRFKSSKTGKMIDLPKSIRQPRQKGGEIFKIFTKDRKPRHSKLVLLADVSASMDIYSTFLNEAPRRKQRSILVDYHFFLRRKRRGI